MGDSAKVTVTVRRAEGVMAKDKGGTSDPFAQVLPRALQGYLAHKKHPPPQDHPRSLGIGLLYGPRRRQFLVSEVPL